MVHGIGRMSNKSSSTITRWRIEAVLGRSAAERSSNPHWPITWVGGCRLPISWLWAFFGQFWCNLMRSYQSNFSCLQSFRRICALPKKTEGHVWSVKSPFLWFGYNISHFDRQKVGEISVNYAPFVDWLADRKPNDLRRMAEKLNCLKNRAEDGL